jgi:hypothetical protein
MNYSILNILIVSIVFFLKFIIEYTFLHLISGFRIKSGLKIYIFAIQN